MDGRAGSQSAAVPAAAGVRLEWWAVPRGVRALVEARLGAPVASAVTQTGGFSPGVAARVRLADGRRVFVKAVGPQSDPGTADLHRAEGMDRCRGRPCAGPRRSARGQHPADR